MSRRIDFTEEQIAEMIKKYDQGASSYDLAEESGVNNNTILNRLREAGCEIRSPGFKKGNTPWIYTEREIPNPWMNVDAAYVFGVLIGDASVGYDYDGLGKRGSPNRIRLCTPDIGFGITFSEAVESAFGIQTISRPRRRESAITFEANSVDLAKVFDKFKWRTETWRIPDSFFDAPREIKVALCQGKFDSDAHVDGEKNRILISAINRSGLKEISKIVNDLGFKTSLTGAYPPSEKGKKKHYRLSVLKYTPELFRVSRKKLM